MRMPDVPLLLRGGRGLGHLFDSRYLPESHRFHNRDASRWIGLERDSAIAENDFIETRSCNWRVFDLASDAENLLAQLVARGLHCGTNTCSRKRAALQWRRWKRRIAEFEGDIFNRES